MVLDAEQVAAAIASGCVFEPASPAAVQRLQMQRKVFTVEGKPMLAGRGDGLYETAGTLQTLIEQGRQLLAYLHQAPAAPEPGAPVVVESVVETVATAVPEIVALVAEEAQAEAPPAAPAETSPEPEAAPPVATAPEAPAKRGRGRPRGPRTRPAVQAAEPAMPEADPEPPAEAAPPAPPTLMASRPTPRAAAALPEAPASRPARRTGRWLTAGAERRGRREQHWTARQK